MSDQKKWFKVWATITIDPHHANMTLEDVGRWTRLGALTVASGEFGRLQIIPPARHFLALMDCPDLEAAKRAIMKLPNVQVEEVESANGGFSVIIKNWFKYQIDSTAYDRVKRSRHKRRGEEKRREENNIHSAKAPKKAFQIPTLAELEEFCKSEGCSVNAVYFLNYYSARGWQFKNGQPMKDWKATVRNWAGRNLGGAVLEANLNGPYGG